MKQMTIKKKITLWYTGIIAVVLGTILDVYKRQSLDREDAKAIPIIAMTANAFTEDRLRAKEAGMNEHIAKPVDANKLVKAIHELLD